MADQLDHLIREVSTTVEVHLGDYTRFVPGAFDGIIGTEIPCWVEGQDEPRLVTVERVEVSPDGTAVYMTIEGPLGDILLVNKLGSFSIGHDFSFEPRL